MTRRDITRAYGELRAPECANQLTSVMNGLEAMGWVREEKPDNPARQPAVWHVNPKVHALFAARAEEEQRRRKESREANSRQFRQ